MKQIKIIVTLLVSAVIASCQSDFLYPAPTSGVTTGNYFTNAEELETAVINMYDGIQGINSTNNDDNHGVQYEFYLTEMRSDNTRTKSQEGEAAQFESYDVVATNGIVADYYASFYNVIFRANVVLENLGNLVRKFGERRGCGHYIAGASRTLHNVREIWAIVPKK